MTKKAYVHITKTEYKSARGEYYYNAWSRDPKVNKNTPYSGKRGLLFVGHKYWDDPLPKCTGSGSRPYSIGIVERDKVQAKKHLDSLKTPDYDPYAWCVDLGIFPLELFT